MQLRNRIRKQTRKALRAIGIAERALVQLREVTAPNSYAANTALELQRKAHWDLLNSISQYTLV